MTLVKGWKLVMYEESEYHFCLLGPFKFNEIHADLKTQKKFEIAIKSKNDEDEENEGDEEEEDINKDSDE